MPSLSRRHFLQSTSALAAASVLHPHSAFAADTDLIVRTNDPFNAEPRLLDLVADRITPVKHFYVRSHGPVPTVDAKDFKLTIDGLVNKPLTLALDDLKQFPEFSVEATLTCAGNRRQELGAIKPVGGVQWDAGAIGNAKWTGVSLAALLIEAGMLKSAKHIWFEGLDPVKEKDGSVAPFGGSIPLADPKWMRGKDGKMTQVILGQRAMLAHTMNGQPLTPEHGFPLRSIVPGYIGARCVKWLSKITLSDHPSPNHYVAEAYKIIQSDAKDEVAAAEPIYTFAINAAICAPAAGAIVKAGLTRVSGYALTSGDRHTNLAKVELSRDGGKNWIRAGLSLPVVHCWQRWKADIELPVGKHDLVVRATDTYGDTMPQQGNWNFKGYLYNGWHHVAVEAV